MPSSPRSGSECKLLSFLVSFFLFLFDEQNQLVAASSFEKDMGTPLMTVEANSSPGSTSERAPDPRARRMFHAPKRDVDARWQNRDEAVLVGGFEG